MAKNENPLEGVSWEDKQLRIITKSFCYFLLNFVWTIDPKTGIEGRVPAWDMTYRIANLFFNAVKHLIILKSRQLLCTWILCAFALWLLLTKKNTSILLLSKKGDAVSDGTVNSLFGKILYIYSKLPPFLRKYQIDDTSRPMRIINKTNNSFISGECTTTDAGRSGTWTYVLLDEHGHHENSGSMWRSFESTSEHIFSISTPNGDSPDNKFCWIWDKGAVESWQKEELWYYEHPDRDIGSVWETEHKRDMRPEDWAQEHGHSFTLSIKGLIFPFEKGKHVQDIGEELISAHIVSNARYGGLDPGLADDTAYLLSTIIPIKIENKWRKILYIYRDYSRAELTPEQNDGYLQADLQRPPGLNYIIYADPSGFNRATNGKGAVLDFYKTRFVRGDNDVKRGLTAIYQLLKADKILIHPGCRYLVEALCHATYPTDSEGKVVDYNKYAHDKYSHILDALRYLCLGIWPILSDAPKKDKENQKYPLG
jgi:hypothetical protein